MSAPRPRSERWQRLLWPFVPAYAAVLAAQNTAYARGLLRVERLSSPVISIGNLSTGGAGKTPLVILLAELLAARGFAVDVLSRGYGRRGSAPARVRLDAGEDAVVRYGDEPLLIAAAAGVPVYVGASRFGAGRLAEREEERSLQRLHLLDDGFQHRRLARTVDIVVLHRSDFSGVLLPAGRLREPLGALRRASIAVLRVEDGEFAPELRRRFPRLAVWLLAREVAVPGGPGPAVAFCGIARPEEFFTALQRSGVELAARLAFGDHHRYTDAEVTALRRSVQETGALRLLTTEKDLVRLSAAHRTALGQVARLEAVPLSVRLLDEEVSLEQVAGHVEPVSSGSGEQDCRSGLKGTCRAPFGLDAGAGPDSGGDPRRLCENHSLPNEQEQEEQLRVLIVRLGAMGDILHALPAVTALRAAHPAWFLGWAIEPQWRALLAADHPGSAPRDSHMPLVDQIHSVPAKRWAQAPLAAATLREILTTRRELRSARYDVCVDLQGAVRSALVASWARPGRLIGEAEPRESLARWWFTEQVSTRGEHVIEQAAEVARAVAHDALPLGLPCLPRDPAAEAWCAAHAPAGPLVLMSPGAGWGAKRWPLERYAAVARSLAGQGVRVVVNASPSEQRIGEDLARQSGALALVPTLSQLIALSRRAALAIAGDTGPLHLAAALGLPTVGIFGPTDPARNGPFHGDHRILRHPASRRDHTRRAETEAGLLRITPEEVLGAALALLASAQVTA